MLDRTIPPPFNRSSSFDLHHPEKKILSNGISLCLVPGGSQDVIKIELVFSAGRWVEQPWGASYFASQLLSKGTANKDSFEIAQIFDTLGAHLEINPGLDFVSISLYSLTRNLEPALSLLLEILTGATLPEKELEQLKSIYLQNLEVNSEKTSFLASKLFRKNLFGEAHPYGKELDTEDVKNLSRANLLEHMEKLRHGLTVFVSGKIDEKSKSLLHTLLATVPAKAGEISHIPVKSERAVNQHQEKEGSVQASIRMGKKSVIRSHPDYVDVLFLNHILGGYFGSRLMKNIREEKGLTYGIHASLHALRHEGYLVIGADVNKENISLTINEIRKEIRRLREEAVDANELETAQSHFIGSLQSELTTSFAHAEKIKTITLFGLPDNYYNQMIARIARLNANDLIKTAGQHFTEDSFLEIAVG